MISLSALRGKLFYGGLCALLAFIMALFLSAPARYAECVLDGISLWAAAVLPAAFPFLFLTALFTGLPPFAAFADRIARPTGALFRVSGAGGAAALLAALSGYPVGARTLFDLAQSGRSPKEERFRLACLVTTSGPAFLVGTVGSLMFGSPKAGCVLIVSHLAAVFLVAFLLGRFAPRPAAAPPLAKTPAGLYDAVYNAVISILCVGGFIALFSCFGQMLADLGLFRALAPLFGDYTEGILRGMLEMTAGCAALAPLHTPLSLALSCALVTFGGACVLCQQLAYLNRVGVKTMPFVAVKAVQAAAAFGICYLLALLFPVLA